MRHRLIILFAFLLLAAPLTAGAASLPGPESRAGDIEPAADYEAVLTVILQEVVTEDGLVRYDRLRGDLNRDFRRVLKAVETYDLDRLAEAGHAEKLAFWLNAYNVQMLQNIIETPEIEHIMDDGYGDAFFKTPFLTAGTGLSLDEIENAVLRKGEARYKSIQPEVLDPRIHVGLNCAAVSCPRLRRRAFTAANVDAELDQALREFAAAPAHFRVEGNQLILSSLLDWYGSDFDRPGLPAGDYLLQAMPSDRPDYARLKQMLAGKSAAALQADPAVTFAYRWEVNRAR